MPRSFYLIFAITDIFGPLIQKNFSIIFLLITLFQLFSFLLGSTFNSKVVFPVSVFCIHALLPSQFQLFKFFSEKS